MRLKGIKNHAACRGVTGEAAAEVASIWNAIGSRYDQKPLKMSCEAPPGVVARQRAMGTFQDFLTARLKPRLELKQVWGRNHKVWSRRQGQDDESWRPSGHVWEFGPIQWGTAEAVAEGVARGVCPVLPNALL